MLVINFSSKKLLLFACFSLFPSPLQSGIPNFLTIILSEFCKPIYRVGYLKGIIKKLVEMGINIDSSSNLCSVNDVFGKYETLSVDLREEFSSFVGVNVKDLIGSKNEHLRSQFEKAFNLIKSEASLGRGKNGIEVCNAVRGLFWMIFSIWLTDVLVELCLELKKRLLKSSDSNSRPIFKGLSKDLFKIFTLMKRNCSLALVLLQLPLSVLVFYMICGGFLKGINKCQGFYIAIQVFWICFSGIKCLQY